jgi:hypothetical protein
VLAVFEFRVTKYDPTFRASNGAYARDEWTSISDIGRTFSGVVLTEADYQRAEDAYVAAAVAFLRDAGVPSVTVVELESHAAAPPAFGEGAVLSLDEAAGVIRRVLREEFWCRLEGNGGFIHIGYDYYMYVGVARPCPEAEDVTRLLGLFVEPLPSPYTEDTGGKN